jgi:hypothetical protein
VDAIVHVQLESNDGPILRSTRPECPGWVEQAYTLQVLEVVSPRGGSVERGSTQQLFRSIHQDRLQPGAQYVALMGTGLILEVVSGRISSSAGESLTGMTVAEAPEVLGQWSRERSQ